MSKRKDGQARGKYTLEWRCCMEAWRRPVRLVGADSDSCPTTCPISSTPSAAIIFPR